MKNFKRRLVFLGVFIVVTAIIVDIFWKDLLNLSNNSDQIIQQQKILEKLVANSSEIHRVWNEGEESEEWGRVKDSCLKKFQITEPFDETLLRCNPMLIECINEFDSKKKFNLNVKNSFKYINKQNSNLKISNSGGFYFELEDDKSYEKLGVILSSNCHESYLDQRIFGYGEMPKPSEGEDYRFDNFDQKIYLDKHLVTNWEVNNWIKAGDISETNRLKIKNSDDLFKPSVELNLSEMISYCQFFGKELMSAHIFDAATFLPLNLEEKEPKNNLRSPYFWTKKSNEVTDRCDYLFSQECLLKNKFKTNAVAPTWQGIFDSMGGVMEAFHNPIDPDLNLKVSSYYLKRNSSWNKLGLRGHWNGEDHDLRSFILDKIDLDKNIAKVDVGFRCMRRVPK